MGKTTLPIIEDNRIHYVEVLVTNTDMPIVILGRPGMAYLLGYWRQRLLWGTNLNRVNNYTYRNQE